MNKLANDVCRCDGGSCPIKNKCLRYTDMPTELSIDTLSWFTMSTQLCDTQEPIKPYWISNDNQK